MKWKSPVRGTLIVGSGHALYQNEEWHGGFPGEEPVYEQHVIACVELFQRLSGPKVVSFTGGRTRPHLPAVQRGEVTVSEGGGMLAYARERGLLRTWDDILAEEYARDSFENVWFSILAFHRHTNAWPAQVIVVSWPFKAVRFYLIACGLGLAGAGFQFRGVGDLSTNTGTEAAALANLLYEISMVDVQQKPAKLMDPLHRGKEFREKRAKRMPESYTDQSYLQEVKKVYASGKDEVLSLVEVVNDLESNDAWRQISWPWNGPTA